MISKMGKTFALIAFAFALQVQVTASTTVMGRLKTRDNKPVLVNGNKATSGTTILSGASIKCPEKIGATVDLGSLGRLDIAPNTELTLRFANNQITVELISGYVVLTTNKGIAGTVTTSEGTVVSTDPTKVSSVVAKTKDASGPEASVLVGAGGGGLGTGGAAGIGAAAAGVVGGTAAAKSGSRGSDLSTDNPRRP